MGDSGPEPDRATGAQAPPPGAAALWDDAGLAQQEFPPGLYVVATPLGNAADVSLRALWVLRIADCVAAEDTRNTAPLLARYGIDRRLVALHQHNEAGASRAVLERLARGERVALVSDAGTPAISDPGAVLVQAALAAGHRVIPVPGASSLTAALSVAGLRAAQFTFYGFAPPRAQARRRQWQEIAASPAAAVIFEAPHRIVETAQELAAALDPERRVVVARELTKKFETVTVLRAAQLPELFAQAPARGEFVLLIDAPAPLAVADAQAAPVIDAVTRRWLQVLAEELPASRAAAIAAKASGLPRAALYASLHDPRDSAQPSRP